MIIIMVLRCIFCLNLNALNGKKVAVDSDYVYIWYILHNVYLDIVAIKSIKTLL